MKQITYNCDGKSCYVADQGEYKGVDYFIVAGGIHPCAYVLCPEEFIKNHLDEYEHLDCIDVHGGVTWMGELTRLHNHPDGWEGMCFGWDYGHAGDWAGYLTKEENLAYHNHKYNLQDIQLECHNAIDQYLDVLAKDGKEPETPVKKEENGFWDEFMSEVSNK